MHETAAVARERSELPESCGGPGESVGRAVPGRVRSGHRHGAALQHRAQPARVGAMQRDQVVTVTVTGIGIGIVKEGEPLQVQMCAPW